MRLVIPAILAAVLLATTACAGKKPPEPTIKAGETFIPTVLSSHCWTTGCADYPVPPDHLRGVEYQPVTVPGGAKLTVTFPTRPIKPITITQWVGQQATPSAFAVPAEPGLYTYNIGARWKQGSAVYIFQVEVK